jgi:hypothetical protein
VVFTSIHANPAEIANNPIVTGKQTIMKENELVRFFG